MTNLKAQLKKFDKEFSEDPCICKPAFRIFLTNFYHEIVKAERDAIKKEYQIRERKRHIKWLGSVEKLREYQRIKKAESRKRLNRN